MLLVVNGNITGLPAPATPSSPVRLEDVSGDLADATITLPNLTVSTFSIGTPVYVASNGLSLLEADASVPATRCQGLCNAVSAPTTSATAQVAGVIVSTDWTSVVGAVNLVPNADYFLSETTGLLTTVPPVTSGAIVQKVGSAVSLTTLSIEIRDIIILQ